jgi:hypothetical protein
VGCRNVSWAGLPWLDEVALRQIRSTPHEQHLRHVPSDGVPDEAVNDQAILIQLAVDWRAAAAAIER